MPTMPKADRPNMLIDRFPAARDEQAALIYSKRPVSVGAWMNDFTGQDLPTLASYARHLCAAFGVPNPDADLVRRIIALANKDY